MGIFGSAWEDHDSRLAENWKREISDDDYVIVVGDISWALRFEDAIPDLDWIHNLPGHKILLKGNHDLWWHGITKMNELYDDMYFLQNTHFMIDEHVAVCGTRGWILPGQEDYRAESDDKILAREVQRLEMSFESGIAAGATQIICATHYPPALTPSNKSVFTEAIEKYPVKTAIYGHLHGTSVYQKGIMGKYETTEYKLVSLDYLNANPLQIR